MRLWKVVRVNYDELRHKRAIECDEDILYAASLHLHKNKDSALEVGVMLAREDCDNPDLVVKWEPSARFPEGFAYWNEESQVTVWAIPVEVLP